MLTLALGIAGIAVMLALLHGVLLRPLPVHEQDRLILAWKEVRTSGSARYPFGDRAIEDVAEASRLIAAAAGVTRNGAGRMVVVDAGLSGYANVAEVTGRFFEVLQMAPVLGRALSPADDKDGAENVIVLSHGFWQRRYGGSRNVIGRRVDLEEQPFRIVGVMPPDFDYPPGVEIWRTTSSVPTSGPFGDAARREVNLVARLRPGVTLQQATSEILALSERADARAPANEVRGLVPIVRPFADVVIGDVRTPLLALFGAVALVLLIAGANVANLLLMRGEARRREIALRAALGAGRARIVCEVLAETVMLAALAGALGLAIAASSLQTLIALLPDGLPRIESIRIDTTVILWSCAVVLVTALLVGLVPALAAMRRDLLSELRTGGCASTSSPANRGRRVLVVAQVALAVAIVAAAGLLVRSVLRLKSVDLGLPADRLVMLDLYIPETKYRERRRHAQLLDEVIARLEAIPGVSAATPVNLSPFSGQGWDVPRFTAEGQDPERALQNPSLNLESIHPNYFETFGITIRRGRAFSAADREGAPEVAIVSEDVAALTWPHANPIGQRLKMGGPEDPGPWYTVVGIAAETRYREVTQPRPTLYLPAAQFQMTARLIVLRTTASLDVVSSEARNRMRAVDEDVQVMRIATFTGMLDRRLARPRFNAWLSGVFAAVALVLSTVGLYAVMGAYVRQREREIALRLALGATTGGVRRFVLAEVARLTGLGVTIGIAGTAIAARLVRSMLFEVDPVDPVTLAAAASSLLATSLLASSGPLRRAARTDPAGLLRGE